MIFMIQVPGGKRPTIYLRIRQSVILRKKMRKNDKMWHYEVFFLFLSDRSDVSDKKWLLRLLIEIADTIVFFKRWKSL